MVEFEPPKPKALSDAELQRAITLLGSSAEGIANSEQLIAEQALLRQSDSEALSAWIRELQADGSAESLNALKKLALDVLPANIEAVEPAGHEATVKSEVAIFTTEIAIIGRKERSKRKAVLRSFMHGITSWILIALVNVLITNWLELTATEAIVATALGAIAAGFVLAQLKSHTLHPLIRAAAVFGGWGVYFGAALALALTALVFLEGALHLIPNDLMITVLPGYRTDVLVIALGVLLLGQLLPRFLHWWVLLVTGLISFFMVVFTGLILDSQSEWFAVAPLPGAVFDPSQYLNWEKISWASFAVSLVTVLVFAFALPHSSTPAWSFAIQVPLGVGMTSALVFLGSSPLAVLAILFSVFLGLSLSGRDLTARPLGRWAAAAFLIPVLTVPLLNYLDGPAVSMLSCLICLLFGDQVVRRTPLHIPSLDTSYGFYGSFQLVTWLGLLISIPFGIPQLQQLLVSNSTFTTHELALIFGLALGVVFSLLRILVIRSQDREIRNVEIRNMNLDNLLGL
ncbi:MAG: hypothetical protein RLZ99_83 [Actinomycetota bacterium]|jgi:hypothetical protein